MSDLDDLLARRVIAVDEMTRVATAEILASIREMVEGLRVEGAVSDYYAAGWNRAIDAVLERLR